MKATDLGVFLPTIASPGEPTGDVVVSARLAESLGFESVWAVDQLIAGTGFPMLESTVALAAAAAATTTIKLGFGVMVLPLRPVAWVAKQVAALQLVSGTRVLLGVGTGGDRHALSWSAAGVSPKERRQRVDEALQTLPSLTSGKPTKLEAVPGGAEPSSARQLPCPRSWLAAIRTRP